MTSTNSATNKDAPTEKKDSVTSKKEVVLSEEDQQLIETISLLIQRLADPEEGLQKAAMESMRQLIRSSTATMTSIPKAFKYLLPHYSELKTIHGEKIKSDSNQVPLDFHDYL